MLRKLAACLSTSIAATLAAWITSASADVVPQAQWNGSSNNLWHTESNWTPSGLPLVADFFAVTGQMNVDVNFPAGVSSLRFAVPGYNLSGQRISVTTSVVIPAVASSTTIANEIELFGGGSITFDVSSNLTLGTVSCGGMCTASLRKIGTAHVIIGNATFQGDVLVQQGTLTVSPSSGLNSLAVTSPASANTGNASWDALFGDGILSIGGATTFQGGLFQGTLGGPGGLVKSGLGTLTLLGNNAWTGGITINAGTLAVGNISAGTFPSGPITNNGLLQVGIPGFATVTSLSGNGNLELYAGTLEFFGPGPWNTGGSITITGGMLNAASLAAVGNVTVQSPGVLNVGGNLGSLAGNGLVSIDGPSLNVGFDNTSTTFSGSIGGTGQLFKMGNGTLTLSGSFTSGPPLIVAGGTLQFDGTGTASTNIQVLNTATLSGAGQVVNDIAVVNGGTLAPGSATLTADQVFLDGKLRIAIAGSAVGQYGRLQANQLALHATTSSLQLTGSYVPVAGDVFVIVNNPSGAAQASTFPGLPEGATIPFNGASLRLTYAHLGGNEIALSVVTRTVTPSVVGNGTISPSTAQPIAEGAQATFTLTPAANHHVVSVSGTCGGSLVGNVFTSNSVTADCTVIATFAIDTYTVTAAGGANGTITPASLQVDHGATTTFTVTANTGYVAQASGCGGALAGTTYTTGAITAPCTVTATFTALVTYNVVLEGWQQVSPYVVTPASGSGTATFNPVTKQLTLNLPYSGLSGTETMAHIHGPAGRGANAGVLHTLLPANPKAETVTLTSAQETMLANGQLYVNIHTSPNYPNGEIRGQIDNIGATVTRVLTVTKAGVGSGTVTGTAEPGTVVNCGSDCAETVPNGKVVGLTATAAVGSTFAGWSGACTGTGACNVTMDAQKTVTATFDIANPPRLGNISTRMQVLTGNDVMIGGFVIGGASNKTVVVRARGPSLVPFGVTNALANPVLQVVRSSDQATIATNDDWQSDPNATAVTASGFAPDNGLEAAVLLSLPPGAYTAIVSGLGNATGVGIVEVFEVDGPAIPLLNISTRGQVRTGNDVMIGGFVITGNGPQTVVVRARGPSLVPFGITNALANPQLQLVRSSDQQTIAANDDWQSASNAADVTASGFAPSDNLEAAILITLQPGAYTAIVSGVGGGTGVGIVEVFAAP